MKVNSYDNNNCVSVMIDDDDNDEWRRWHLSGGCRAQQLLLPNCLFRHFTAMQCNAIKCNAMQYDTMLKCNTLCHTLHHSRTCKALFRHSTPQTAIHCSDTQPTKPHCNVWSSTVQTLHSPAMYHSVTPPQGCNALFRHSTACAVLLFIELNFIALVAYTT